MAKNLFDIGELSNYHIIAFLIPLCYLATSYVQRDIIAENKNYHKNKNLNFNNNNYELPYLINIFISKLFACIFYVISKYILNKEEITPELKSSKSIRVYHLNVNAHNKLKILSYIIIISILEVTFQIEKVRNLQLVGLIEIKVGLTIFVPLFSFIILKIKYYRHHFVAIGIGLFGFIFIVISLFFPNNDQEKHSFIEHLIHLLFSIPFSLSLVLINQLFKYYFIDPFTFLFLDGIFCLLFSFIYIIIKILLILQKTDLFINNVKKLSFIFLSPRISGLFICIFIFSFLFYITNTLTLYYFTPTLLVMTDIISPVIRWIVDSLIAILIKDFNLNIKQTIFKIIGYIFLIIASFIFNEIIICNFWKMNYNTIEEIKIRSIEDAIKRDSILNSNNESIISNL